MQDRGSKGNGEAFYFHITKHPGFYTVCDQEGGYLYPLALQDRFAAVIHGVKQMARLKGTHAPLHDLESPNYPKPSWERKKKTKINQSRKDKEDRVLALRCHRWPKDVWKNFQKRKPGHLHMEQLKGDLIKCLVFLSNLSLASY